MASILFPIASMGGDRVSCRRMAASAIAAASNFRNHETAEELHSVAEGPINAGRFKIVLVVGIG